MERGRGRGGFRGRGRGNYNNNNYRNQDEQQAQALQHQQPSGQEQEHHRPERRRNRAQNYRENRNESVIADFAKMNLERLRSDLFGEFSSLKEALITAKVDPQAQSIRISATTRGIGLTLFSTLNRISAQMPDVNIPIHSFYRVSLMQFAAKLDVSQLQRGVGFVDPLDGEEGLLLDSDMRNLVSMNPQNVTPVAGVINCVGLFSHDDVKYFPSMVTVASPLNVTIRTLRQSVVMLSNPVTPLEVRQRWVALNSIPGAQFEDELDPILVNPDDVIPGNYDLPMARNDFLLVNACLAKIGRKTPKLAGVISFNEKGNKGQLLTATINANTSHIWSFVDFNEQNNNYVHNVPPHIVGDVSEWHTAVKLSQDQAVSGAITLTGEIEIQRPAEITIPWFANRNPRSAVARYSFSRENVISGLLG